MNVLRTAATAAWAAICCLLLAGLSSAQTTGADAVAAEMFDSLFEPDPPASAKAKTAARPKRPKRKPRPSLTATLARGAADDVGLAPYVLVDRYGGVLRYVEPVEGIDLESRIGKQVTVRHDTGDILLASQLDLPRSRRSVPGDDILLTQAAEEIAGAKSAPESIDGLVVPEGSDPVFLDGGIDGGIDLRGPSRIHAGTGYTPADPRSRPRFYSRFEYALWWFNGFDTPPLVTTATDPDDLGALPMPGSGQTLLDRPTTQILYGGNEILDEDARSGARVTLGTWIGDWAIEGDYTIFGEETETFFASGVNGNPIISRPFFNLVPPDITDVDNDGDIAEVGPPIEDAQFVSFPDVVSGSVTVNSQSEFLMAGVHLRLPVCCEDRSFLACGDCVGCSDGVGCGSVVSAGRPARKTDFLIGYRYAELDEYLQVFEDLQPIGGAVQNITVLDRFETNNQFNGAEVGFVSEWLWRRWSFELLSKLAIGNVSQQITIFGQTTNDSLPPDPGGLLTQVSNIGTYKGDDFAVLPEIGATLGYSVTQRLRVTAGYSLIYLTPVVRPGDQIDREINPDLIPPTILPTFPLRPEPLFVKSDLYAHGLRFGLHLDW
ncbi:MAG: BBP7 family outer membrane beta-barrel protein [Planctomycetota bacterium]